MMQLINEIRIMYRSPLDVRNGSTAEAYQNRGIRQQPAMTCRSHEWQNCR
jgi:hypothetical protein